MKITITVEQPTGDFQTRLLTLLGEYAGHVEIDRTWTLRRAEDYYRSLPARARRIVKEAVVRDGYVPAEELRDDETSSLRGHSAALTRALQRGFMRGLWPEDMQAPIEPQGPGFGKVVGYRMPDDLVETFFAAIASTEAAGTPAADLAKVVDGVRQLTEALDATTPKKTTKELR